MKGQNLQQTKAIRAQLTSNDKDLKDSKVAKEKSQHT